MQVFFNFQRMTSLARLGEIHAHFQLLDMSEWSQICSKHYPDDCHDQAFRLKKQLKVKVKFSLKEGAVPSLKWPSSQSMISMRGPLTSHPGGK